MHKLMLSMALVASLLSHSAQGEDMEAAAFRDAFLASNLNWEEVQNRAEQEGNVNLYYWGGSDPLNIWMDQVVTPALAERGVTLNPVRITSTKDAIDLVIAEKASGKGLGEGSVDAIWLNGENFATLKQQDALFGAFADKLPNSKNIEWNAEDPRAQLNLRDFGVITGKAEVPWSGEQYVCLKTYLEEKPGKFTYVKPPHYLGNTFVQAAVYAHNPDGTGAEPFQRSIDEIGDKELARLIAPGLEYLKALEPYLLGAQSGKARYAEDDKSLDGMFLNGEIDIACKFGVYAVAVGLSEAQVSKLQFTGMPPGVDPWKLSKADVAALNEASPGLIGVTQKQLDENTAPDTNATLVDVIEASWLAYIERGSSDSIAAIVQRAVENLAN